MTNKADLNSTGLVAQLLSTSVVARPVRKVVWVAFHAFERAAHALRQFYWAIPYNRLATLSPIGSAAKPVAKFSPVAQYYGFLRPQLERFVYRPKISILLPVYKVKVAYLRQALASVAFQLYDNWELCVVDDASGQSDIDAEIKAFAAVHQGKVNYAVNEKNMHISLTSNRCLEMATGEYVVALDHDDRLYPQSLAEIVRYLNLCNKPDVLYTDERKIKGNGELLDLPFYKPGYSPFLLLSVHYATHLSCYRTELLRAVGGFRAGFEGSQDHDAMLRVIDASPKPVVHIPMCLYQWRAHEESTAAAMSQKPYAVIAGEKAVAEALKRRGRPADVEFLPETQRYRIRLRQETPLERVSIVIPTKDGFDLVSKCLQSILEKTSHPDFEIVLVDNGTKDGRCLEFFSECRQRLGEKFIHLKKPGPFNFAHLINEGAKAASGRCLMILNNDTEVQSSDWLEEMQRFAQLPEIGAVGCKLLYPDGRIQQAGIVMMERQIAMNAGAGLEGDSSVYMNMFNTLHETAGVTAACMMIEKSKFEGAGGMDETWVPNGYGDVDFSLTLRARGWTNLYTPYAVLEHKESPSRKACVEKFEKDYMLRRWARELSTDPYVNPHFLPTGRFDVDVRNALVDDYEEVVFRFLSTHKHDDWNVGAFSAWYQNSK